MKTRTLIIVAVTATVFIVFGVIFYDVMSALHWAETTKMHGFPPAR